MIYELKNSLPPWLERAVIRTWYGLRPLVRLAFFGREHFCPVCDSQIRGFLPHKARALGDGVVCPVCLCHPRHRMAWKFFHARTPLFDRRAKRLVHFAPETALVSKLRDVPGVEYLSVDRDSPHAMSRMDITSLRFEAASVDAIYCSHVLEHVQEDRQAMREMRRVLRPGGWAAIQVPLSGTVTHEDSTITDPRDRDRVFGQRDHVRYYGMDIVARLQAAGFEVTVIRGVDVASEDECRVFGFSPGEIVFLCQKRGEPPRPADAIP